MQMSKRCLAVLLVAVLTLGLYGASLIDWNSEDIQDNPLALFNQKETIRVWYGDESLANYISSAAVAYGEENNVRILPYYMAESDYLEAINSATLGDSDGMLSMPDVYLISHESLERAYLAGLAVPVDDPAGTQIHVITYKIIIVKNIRDVPRKNIHSLRRVKGIRHLQYIAHRGGNSPFKKLLRPQRNSLLVEYYRRILIIGKFVQLFKLSSFAFNVNLTVGFPGLLPGPLIQICLVIEQGAGLKWIFFLGTSRIFFTIIIL